MYNSLRDGKPIVLTELDTFVDGASMKKASSKTFVNFFIIQEILR